MLTLRPETAADRAAIAGVHIASFPTPVEAHLVDALRTNHRLTVSLIACETDTIVGHVSFSPVTLDRVEGGIGLAPVAVLPAFRRHGIAAALIRQGLLDLDRLGFRFVVVLGEPDYYRRFGFQPAANWGLRDEYGGGGAFQALELRPGALPAGGGLVRYAPEFGGLGLDVPNGG